MMNGFLMALLAMKLPDIACEGSPLVLARRKLVWKASVAQPKPSFFLRTAAGNRIPYTTGISSVHKKKGYPNVDVGYSLLALEY